MKPENSSLPQGLEQLPMPPVSGGEHIPVAPTPEAVIESGGERHEQAAEASAIAADAAAIGVFTPLPGVSPVVTTTTPTDDNPLIAADEDVIEKEWVDKAKKILQETKDDPHARTTRVNELQRDYLKKRYGKDLGVAIE